MLTLKTYFLALDMTQCTRINNAKERT